MWWPPPYRRPPDRAAGDAVRGRRSRNRRVPPSRARGYDPLVDDPASVSFWLETAGDDLTPRPPLDGSTDADVAILGARPDRPLDRLLPRAPRSGAADRDRGAGDRRVRGVGPQRGLVRARPQHLDGPPRAAPRGRRRPAHAAGDLRRGGRGGPRVRRGGDRRRVPQGRRDHRRARPPGRAVARGRRSGSTSGSGSATGTGWSMPRALEGRIRIAGAVRALVSDDAAVVHPGRLVRGLARAVEGMGVRIVEGTAVTGVRPRDASGRAALVTAAGRRPGARRGPRRRGLPEPAAGPAPPADPAVLADRPDGAGQRRAVGGDRLGEPRGRGLDPPLDRLPVAHRGRPDPVRRARRALPARLPDQPRHGPPRPHPRAAPRVRPRVVPGAARHPVHACLGRAAGHAAGLAPDDRVRPGHRHRHRARLHRPRRVDDEPRRPGADRARSPAERGPADRAAAREPPLAGTGRSSRSGSWACATRSGRSGAWTMQRPAPGGRRTGRSLAERIAAH